MGSRIATIGVTLTVILIVVWAVARESIGAGWFWGSLGLLFVAAIYALVRSPGLRQALSGLLRTRTSASSAYALPRHVRMQAWNTYIGPEKARGYCEACGSEISIQSFEAGHVKARARGGTNGVDNLRPVCSGCNKAMGTMNLYEFRARYFPEWAKRRRGSRRRIRRGGGHMGEQRQTERG